MIIFDGNGDAISFNDETSPDTRYTGLTKVHINGQFNRGLALEWFYKLLALFPDIPGELKSAVVVSKFKDLSPEIRNTIWSGLSSVRIHIVDPRPNYRRGDDLLREIWKDEGAPEMLRQMAEKGVSGARSLLARLREIVAESILKDSTAVRVQELGRALVDPFGPVELDELPFFNADKEHLKPPITVRHFGKPTNIVGDVSSWSAKSSAAFQSALDAATIPEDFDEMSYRFGFERILIRRMMNELRRTHAFDKGNERHIKLLESTRRSMIDDLAAHARAFRLVTRPGFVEVESRESYYIQAADFAAGIASDIYASQTLVGVVKHFEYVTYNGVRVSLADAEEEMRREKN